MITENGKRIVWKEADCESEPIAVSGTVVLYGKLDKANRSAVLMEDGNLYYDLDERTELPEELKNNRINLDEVYVSLGKNRSKEQPDCRCFWEVCVNKARVDMSATKKYNSGKSNRCFYLALDNGMLMKCTGKYKSLLDSFRLKKKDYINKEIISPLLGVSLLPEDLIKWWCVESPIKGLSMFGFLVKENQMTDLQAVATDMLIPVKLENGKSNGYLLKAGIAEGSPEELRKLMAKILRQGERNGKQ